MRKIGVYYGGKGRRGACRLSEVLTSDKRLGQVLVMVLKGLLIGGSSAEGSEG